MTEAGGSPPPFFLATPSAAVPATGGATLRARLIAAAFRPRDIAGLALFRRDIFTRGNGLQHIQRAAGEDAVRRFHGDGLRHTLLPAASTTDFAQVYALHRQG